MEHRGVIITCGFNKSRYAIAVAELLQRKDVSVKGFIIVSPYSMRRLRKYLKKRGVSFLKEALPRLVGQNRKTVGHDYLGKYMKDHDIHYRSVKAWCVEHESEILNVNSLNEYNTVSFLKKKSPQWLIYGGGGILKENVIDCMNGRILNAHQGPLPEIRGMNAAEWTFLLDQKKEITIHLIDRGIDTGKIIMNLAYSLDKSDTISTIRDKAKIKCIEGLVEVASAKNLNNYVLKENNDYHRQCYILSPIMKELLREKLNYIL